MNTNMIFFIFILIMVPVFIFLMFIPYWTRKTESFGVLIPEAIYNRSELKAMRKKYTVITGILSILTILIFALIDSAFAINESALGLLFSIIIPLYLIICFVVYLNFHRKMKIFKANEKWTEQKTQQIVINTQFRKQKLTHSNLWFIISFVITIVTLFITIRLYDQIPERIPMQYNFDGDVTNWSNKSYRSVLTMPVMQMYLTFLFLLINVMIGKAKQQVSAENPEQSLRQNVIFRRRWSAFIIITGIALTILFSLIQLSFIYPINQQLLTIVPLIFSFGVVIATIILSITTGQGGSRVKIGTGKSGEVINRDDDQYWKLGLFYCNKNDPALFLEKRFGIGWTINFARPLAWSIFLLIILLAIGIPLILQ